jgi:Gpi18-like mannosyltransferase
MEIAMLLRRKLFINDTQHLLVYAVIAVMFVLALVLRIALYPIKTSDYTIFVSQWYDFIKTHRGFAALKYNFANYNVPYLYLLALCTYLPIPQLIAIKTLSVVFDGVLGLFTYLIVRLRYRPVYAALLGALVIVWAPTIIINSSAWGQCDAIYAAFCLGSLYFLLKERPAWACVFFALALSFKLQAIFFSPVLLILPLKRKLALKHLVLIPLIFLLMLVPAFLAGRDAQSLLTIYIGQITSSGAGGAGPFQGTNVGRFNGGARGQFNGTPAGQFGGQPPVPSQGAGRRQFNGGAPGPFQGGGFGRNSNSSFTSLTANAPSFYQWLPANASASWKWLGIFLAAIFISFVGVAFVASKQRLTSTHLLKGALAFAVAIPFLLPYMHERYFYLADVLSIVSAFYVPRTFYVAIGVQLCSLLSYAPYLINTQVIELRYVAVAVLVLTFITSVDLVLALYPNITSRGIKPKAPDDETHLKVSEA